MCEKLTLLPSIQPPSASIRPAVLHHLPGCEYSADEVEWICVRHQYSFQKQLRRPSRSIHLLFWQHKLCMEWGESIAILLFFSDVTEKSINWYIESTVWISTNDMLLIGLKHEWELRRGGGGREEKEGSRRVNETQIACFPEAGVRFKSTLYLPISAYRRKDDNCWLRVKIAIRAIASELTIAWQSHLRAKTAIHGSAIELNRNKIETCEWK